MDHEAAAEVIVAIVPEVTGKLELPDGLDASHGKDIAVSFDVETALRSSVAQRSAGEPPHVPAVPPPGLDGKEVRVEQHRHVRRGAERLPELDLELAHGVRVLRVKNRAVKTILRSSAGSPRRREHAPRTQDRGS